MKDKVIGPRKPKGISNSPWERRIRKRAEDAQGKQMGQRCQEEINGTQEPASNVIKSPMIIRSHWEKNK